MARPGGHRAGAVHLPRTPPRAGPDAAADVLTARERQVLVLIGTG